LETIKAKLDETPFQTAGPFLHIGCMPNAIKINKIYQNDLGEIPFKNKQEYELITIEGKDIIDNADMFKRAPLPSYLSWVLPLLKIGSKFSSIDPHYTRFESDLRLSIDDTTFQGHGVLEIMDLK